jgi:flap endonuclease-1
MGVLGLLPFLRKQAPEAFVGDMKFEHGTVVVIDALLSIYQTYCSGTARGLTHNHIAGTIHRSVGLIEEGFHPVWVFDGAPPTLKDETLASRADRPEMGQVIAESRELIDVLGLQYVDAAGEAEAQCVEFVKSGKAAMVLTNDSDCLMLGVPIMRPWVTGKKPQEYIILSEVLKGLQLTFQQFQDMCILMGTDYNDRLLGPVTSLKKIREHKTLEAVLENHKNLTEEKHVRILEAAREIRNPNVIPSELFHVVRPEPATITKIGPIIVEMGMSEKRVDSALKRLKKHGWVE